MFVKIICDSVTEHDKRIVTFHAHYPRPIHGEVMTHRIFSRNARSSRAVPVKTMIQEVIDKPFIPWHWGKNQKGMQATLECNEDVMLPDYPYIIDKTCEATFQRYNEIAYVDYPHSRKSAWLWSRDQAVKAATGFADAGYHKQIANRILEPYSWIDTLITTTNLSNFYHLRDHDDAEPHFHDLAALTRYSVDNSRPKLLKAGDWHTPYVTELEKQRMEPDTWLKVSVARCARISYTPFDGNPSIERELERYEMLVGSEPLHASPAEHQARADWEIGRSRDNTEIFYDNEELSGNLGPGFVQYRKTLKNEFYSAKW